MQNQGLLQDYIFFSRLTKALLLMVGLYPITKPSKFYRVLPIFNLVIMSTITLFVFNYVRLYCTSIKTLTRGLSFGTSYLTIILKVRKKKNYFLLYYTIDNNCNYFFVSPDFMFDVQSEISHGA